MIAAPRPGDDWTDPTTGERVTVGAVDLDAGRITFARWGRMVPKVDTMNLTDFFERYMRPNLPDDCEV